MKAKTICIPCIFITETQPDHKLGGEMPGCTLSSYPLAYEHQLKQMIGAANREGAQKALTELLRYISLSSSANFKTMKARVCELLVIMSRAAMESGGDPEEMFRMNDDYAKKLADLNDMGSLAVTIHEALQRFVGCVFDFSKVKHQGVLLKITEFIRHELPRKITLEEVANHVYLSKAYLSRIIRRELGVTFIEYVNNLRVERSKPFLMEGMMSLEEISQQVGFCDQSYFTKIFKRATGISPSKYRENSVHW